MPKLMKIAVLTALLAICSSAFAATQLANTNTVAPTLRVSATIQRAVQLTLATGTTSGLNHCAVTATGTPDFSMDFGTVDALAISGPSCGQKFAPANPGVDNAVYWTDYNVTPVFTGHRDISGTNVTAQVTTNFGGPNIFVVRSSDATSATQPASAAAMIPMGVTTADTITSAVTSGTAFTRFIGVAVTPQNGNTVLQGAQSATVTFTLTVQ